RASAGSNCKSQKGNSDYGKSEAARLREDHGVHPGAAGEVCRRYSTAPGIAGAAGGGPRAAAGISRTARGGTGKDGRDGSQLGRCVHVARRHVERLDQALSETADKLNGLIDVVDKLARRDGAE